MQLNRALSRMRMVRPRRMPVVVVTPRIHHMRWINTRPPTSSSSLSSSSPSSSSSSSSNNHFPNRIESKLDNSKTSDTTSTSGRSTGGAGLGSGSGYGGSSGSSGISSSSSSSDNRGSSSAYSGGSHSGAASGFGSGSSGSAGSSSSLRTSMEKTPASPSSFGTNFADQSDQSTTTSDYSQSMGRAASSYPSTSSSSSSSYPSSSSSSSDGFMGSKSADGRHPGVFGTSESKYRQNAKGEEEGFSDKAKTMVNRAANKVAESGSSLGETASRMADKVSEKFSGGGKNDQQKYTRENKYSGDTDRSYSETSRPASDYGRSSSSYGGSSSYGSDSSSSSDNSFGDTVNRMTNKMSDKISEGSSAIGQTLHKISDKISETLSGVSQSGSDRSQGSNYNYSSSSSSEGNKMMSPRRNSNRDSSISPFDLSSFFRNNFFGDWGETFSGRGALSMKTDIIEHDNEYRVICDLPGVSKSDINISLRKNYLEIYGERSEGYEQGDDHTVHCQERYFGSFTRRLTLPNDASTDMSGIKAKCDNGVLTVTIPKSQRSSSRDRYNVNIE